MTLYTRFRHILLVAFLAPATAFATTSAAELPLSEVARAALTRGAATATGAPPFSASAWLAALPSLEASYLRSEEPLGTDESELGLNLPLKSPFLRKQDARLRQLAADLAEAEHQRQRLYYSGLVREALWSASIAERRAGQTQRKITLLQELRERTQALFDARGASRYALLLVSQELVDARLEHEDQLALENRWRERYRALTGLGTLPRRIEEAPVTDRQAWQAHPALRLLDLGWEQQQALIAAGGAHGAPWNLRLAAKHLESPAFDDTQYGVSIEVPLGFAGSDTQSSSSEWQAAARAHARERDEMQLTLAQSWRQLQLEARHLQRRQALLDEAAGISGELSVEATALGRLNELGSEIRIKRLIADLDRQSEAAINQLLIGQNRAMSQQAAGIPL
ncbi:TolC family protein [Parahaliea mediterranea]|uniref:TolC family protein n=1 Tax=Parahaliea mediterranea TaxID=651086 RepID=A0A939DD04_9GAMM|nr:TolC family protein [Parahaliea mediterranea]MBN7795953.1 TolC family protein [Parahaliea mediterranea]